MRLDEKAIGQNRWHVAGGPKPNILSRASGLVRFLLRAVSLHNVFGTILLRACSQIVGGHD
jgi:hypothetical protein